MYGKFSRCVHHHDHDHRPPPWRGVAWCGGSCDHEGRVAPLKGTQRHRGGCVSIYLSVRVSILGGSIQQCSRHGCAGSSRLGETTTNAWQRTADVTQCARGGHAHRGGCRVVKCEKTIATTPPRNAKSTVERNSREGSNVAMSNGRVHSYQHSSALAWIRISETNNGQRSRSNTACARRFCAIDNQRRKRKDCKLRSHVKQVFSWMDSVAAGEISPPAQGISATKLAAVHCRWYVEHPPLAAAGAHTVMA